MDCWVTVNGVNYNIASAPATRQVELLNTLGAAIMARHAQTDAEIDVNLIVGILLVSPYEKLNQIAGIVLYKTVREGQSKPIDIGDFQDRATDYLLLVAEAIKANLQDFFIYLASSQKSENETQTKAK